MKLVLLLSLYTIYAWGQSSRPAQQSHHQKLSEQVASHPATRNVPIVGHLPLGPIVPPTCSKPVIWESLEIPAFRSAASMGWEWANDGHSSLSDLSRRIEHKLTSLSESSKGLSGQYPAAAIRRDMDRYTTGLRAVSSCPGFSGRAGILELPIISLHHITNRVAMINHLRAEARRSAYVPGQKAFSASEAHAYYGAAPVDGVTLHIIKRAVSLALSDDLSTRAQQQLERIVSVAPQRTSSLSASAQVARNSSRAFANAGLARRSAAKQIKVYSPSTPHNYSMLQAFLDEGRRVLAKTSSERINDNAWTTRHEALAFAFIEASEELEGRADDDLNRLQVREYLAESVDALGRVIEWGDMTRYIDYRDIAYTISQTCSFCDATLYAAFP